MIYRSQPSPNADSPFHAGPRRTAVLNAHRLVFPASWQKPSQALMPLPFSPQRPVRQELQAPQELQERLEPPIPPQAAAMGVRRGEAGWILLTALVSRPSRHQSMVRLIQPCVPACCRAVPS